MIGFVIVMQNWSRSQTTLGQKALLFAESVAVTAPTSLLRKDYWSLYSSLKHIASRPSNNGLDDQVLTGMVLDDKGEVQAHLQPARNPIGLPYIPADEEDRAFFELAMSARTPTTLSSGGFSAGGFQEGVLPIYSDQKYLGVVRIRLSTDHLRKKAFHSAITVLAITLGFVVLGSLFGIMASRRMVAPLTAVTRGLEKIGRGNLNDFTPIKVSQNDEIGRLSATFNRIARELEEKKNLEQEIAMSEKLVALGRITAGVAHEVNNPLAGLLNCIDTLRAHPDDPELQERYLPLIEQGLHRIKNIVGSLLVELRAEDSDELVSTSCLDHVNELITAEIGDRDINFVWESRLDNTIQMQGRRVQQIVCNLLKNAIDVLPAGGTVSFLAFQDGPCMVFEITDNGSGIPREHRDKLFDPFFTTKSSGTGLGLWVVYRLVESMHGVIEVESEEGTGSTFKVILPVENDEASL